MLLRLPLVEPRQRPGRSRRLVSEDSEEVAAEVEGQRTQLETEHLVREMTSATPIIRWHR